MVALTDLFLRSRIASPPSEARGSNNELMSAVTAASQHCLDDQKDSNNPGHAAWTFPIIRMMSHHMAHCTKLPFVVMADDADDDMAVGQPLRQANSRFVWANDPNNNGQRIKVIVESRPGVVQLIEEHLNRNGDNYRLAQDLGPPPPVAQAPVVRGRGRRRSFDQSLLDHCLERECQS